MKRLTIALGLIALGCEGVKATTMDDLSVAADLSMVDGEVMVDEDLAGADLAPVPTCTAGMACDSAAGNGLCQSGACVACADPADDGACAAVYPGSKCIAGACVVAECRAPSDCSGRACVGGTCAAPCASDIECTAPNTICNTTTGACVTNASCGGAGNGAACPVNASDLCCGTPGSAVCQKVECCGSGACGAGGTCSSGVCVPAGCTAAAGTIRYVDLDAATSGVGSKDCPYNLINLAAYVLSSGGGTIVVKRGSSTASTESQGHILPAGVSIIGGDANFDPCTESTCVDSNQWPQLNIDAAHHGISITSSAGARSVKFLRITGVGRTATTKAGVYVEGEVTLEHLRIKNFDIGVDVPSGGKTTINENVHSTNNNYGLKLSGGSDVNITVADDGQVTRFSENDINGIYVCCNAKFKLKGPYSPSRVINVDQNGEYGVRFYSSDTTPPSIDGLNSENNGTKMLAGKKANMMIFADSYVKVRNSRFGASPGSGVKIDENGANSLLNINFGKSGDNGNNTFAATITDAKVCLTIQENVSGNILPLRGNIFGTKNCASNAETLTINLSTCNAPSDAARQAIYYGAWDTLMCNY